MELHKEYTNGEVTVVWRPRLCFHSKHCFKGLPEVFDFKARPWVNPDGAGTEKIITQVNKCPSAALSYFMNKEKDSIEEKEDTRVEVMKNGPLIVHSNVKVELPDGTTEVSHLKTSFCRCGESSKKPYCDGTHLKTDFKG